MQDSGIRKQMYMEDSISIRKVANTLHVLVSRLIELAMNRLTVSENGNEYYESFSY